MDERQNSAIRSEAGWPLNRTGMLIDSHCHLDQYPAPEAVCRECVAGNITVVAVTNIPAHYALATTHLRGMPTFHPALGLHPLAIAKHRREIATFRRLAAGADYIGEVGLDFSREGASSRPEQEEAFEIVLSAIAGRRRFVTLHSRGAEKEVLEALFRHKIGGAVFHWYSGSLSQCEAIATARHYFSINTAMLRGKKIESLLSLVPREQILAETDGPHVTTDDRAAVPGDVAKVYQYLAQHWRVSVAEVESQLASNFSDACGSQK